MLNLSQKLDYGQRFMCRLFINRPEWVFSIGTTILLLFLVLVGPNMEISPNTDFDWTVSSSEESKYQDITDALLLANDPINENQTTSIPERSMASDYSSFQVMYEHADNLEQAIFTPSNLQTICQLESLLWDIPEFHASFCQKTSDRKLQMPNTTGNCITPKFSIVPRFYRWPPYGNATSRECVLLSQEQVDQVERELNAQLKVPGAPTAYFIGANVEIANPSASWRTRSLIELGAPLQGYTSESDRETEQIEKYDEFAEIWEEKLFDFLGLESTFTRSAYRNDAIVKGLEVNYFSQMFMQLEFKRVVNGDLTWAIGSIVFVYLYMAFHTKSFFLASVGMMQIICSLPISYAIYRYIYGIPFYTQLHILAIFLVLGIGADDMFVLVDAWKQALNAAELKDAHVFHKMLRAYQRAFGAIFSTSLTTAMAFVATALSPVMPISAFGYFAATAIVLNYFYVVFFTPAAVAMHYKYLNHRGFCGCGVKKGATSARPAFVPISSEDSLKEPEPIAPSISATESTPGNEKLNLSFLDRFFAGPYVQFLRNKTCAVLTVVILGALMIQGIYFALQLDPPVETEAWFPEDHMTTGILDDFSANFLAGPDTGYIEASFVWGVDDLDRSNFDKWIPDKNRGEPIFKENFDISSTEAHETLLNACTALRDAKCDLKGCMDNSGKLMREGTVKCWIEAMRNTTGGTLPTGEAFNTALASFRAANPQYGSSIGMIDGQLKFVRLEFVLTLEKLQPYEVTVPVNEEVTRLLNELNNQAPASLDAGFVEAGRWFTWVRTEEGLVDGMYKGLAICFPIAFLVLLFVTGNILLSFYAIGSIVAIVFNVLGFCQSVMGWHLGTAESVSAVIVIGFSVDYIVHLGHTYEASDATTRVERAADASRIMGPTVAAGAVTTLGSGCMMFACQMVFFTKMATLITLTISLSLVYSLGFFLCFCSLFGPVGETGSIYKIFSRKPKKSTEYADDIPAPYHNIQA